MHTFRRVGAAIALLALSAASTVAFAYTETSGGWNLPTGATEISREVYGLHMMMFWVCAVIGVLVFGVMFYSIFKHRKSLGAKPASFHHSTTVEIIWTAIPFVILIAVAIPAAGTLIKMEDTRNSDLTVKITGYQWKWQYEILGEDVSYFSSLSAASNAARQLGSGIDPRTVENYLVDVDRPLVIPVGKKVRFLITSNDVIHAWWVPELAVKKDAIPGYINEAWARIEQPGVFRGVCAELCGRDHGFMPIVVEAVSESDFAAWLDEQRAGGSPALAAAPTSAGEGALTAAAIEVASAGPAVSESAADLSRDDLMAAGAKVYGANCSACHQASGAGIPPSFPSLIGSSVVSGDAAVQIDQLLKGKGLMPPFRQLSDVDLAAVTTYTRNSWGNDNGVVQPSAVTALR